MPVDTGGALAAGAQGAAAGSVAGPWGAAIGAGVGVLGSVLGGNAAAKAAKDAAKAQEEMYQRNLAILESVGIPPIEAQKIALENPEYVGDLVNETLGASQMENISLDPQLRQNQMDVLAQLKDISKSGMGIEDKINFDQMQQEVAAGDQSRQRAIQSEMAQRGTLDSGAALAMQQDSIARANQAAQQNAQALAKQAQAGRMSALSSLADRSGQMEGLDWSRQAQQAGAGDAIQQFNANVRNQAGAYNQQNKQNLAGQKAANTNQQEMYNKGLIQQEYGNKIQQAGMKMGMNTAQGANQAQAALTAGQGQAQMYAGIGSGLGNIAAGIGQHYQGASDRASQNAHEIELAKIKK